MLMRKPYFQRVTQIISVFLPNLRDFFNGNVKLCGRYEEEAQYDFLDSARVCMALKCTVHAWFGGLAKSVSVVSDTMRHLRFFSKGSSESNDDEGTRDESL